MLRFLLVLGLLISSNALVVAQEEYRAILTYGRTYLSTPNGFHQVEPGELVADTALLQLVDNAALTLMDRAGRLINLDQTGKFDLTKVDLSQGTDSSMLIFEIWDQFYLGINQTTYGEAKVEDDQLTLPLPSSTEVYTNRLILGWKDLGASKYTLEFLDEFEEVFERRSSNRPAILVDLLSQKFVWKRQFYLRLIDEDSGKKTGLYGVTRVSPPDFDRAQKLLDNLTSEADLTKILTLAAYYEQRGWMADVHSLLYLLANIDEKIRTYYLDFLDRNGFATIKYPFRK